MSSGLIKFVCVGAIGEIGSEERKIKSAFVKTPQSGPVSVGPLGLSGDEHVYKDHGGPDSALLAYPHEHYSHWHRLGIDLPVAGAMGENLTTSGLIETDLWIGDIFEVGSCVIQVTEPRSPCHKLAARYGLRELPELMRESGFTGTLFRVLVCGEITEGDELRLRHRDPHHSVSVHEAGQILDVDRKNLAGARRLYAVPSLGHSARLRIAARLS